ncbi:hypothetical protein V6N13_102082 [Hibiscus sabdariffa]|uniref:anthranilate synthase n=1 Tax=Hibiscus sabdariffa TaxID=183260 RepID=A0ABR2D3S0_9ROSI
MAANFITQSSLIQPKSSLCAKTHLCLAAPSFLLHQVFVFCRKRELGLLENCHWHRLFDCMFEFCYMGELGCRFEVYRNDELTVEELKRKNPRGVLISPGPGTPQDSGISLQTVLELGPIVPLFGVCMGLQCIGEAFGGECSSPFNVGRYHSLVIEKGSFPKEALEVTAWTEDGLIMAARHKVYKHVQGVQFHPESIITSKGKTIVRNFIKLVERKEAAEYRT